jgi:hypothetical protein
MQAEIDKACTAAGVWPHAVLSGHAHNYQRFTRTRSDGTAIPYVVSGNLGHGLQKLSPRGGPVLRAPQLLQKAGPNADQLVFDRYDDANFGYLRVVATQTQLRIEYHPASDGTQAKTPDDSITVDLQTRKIVTFQAKDLGNTAAVRRTAQLAAQHPATWTPAKTPRTATRKRTGATSARRKKK